jgi:heme/copper-type cytochrome/quinol oxidase subunit 4
MLRQYSSSPNNAKPNVGTSQALRRCGISFASSLEQVFGFVLKLKLTTLAWIYSVKLRTEVRHFTIVEVLIRLPHFRKTFCYMQYYLVFSTCSGNSTKLIAIRFFVCLFILIIANSPLLMLFFPKV